MGKGRKTARYAVRRKIAALQDECDFWRFLQFEFYRELAALKDYAKSKNVALIGDIPIYVAYDSADVWAHPEIFRLDKNMRPKEVAGVPPDYFSADGQLWGNPLYDWKNSSRTAFVVASPLAASAEIFRQNPHRPLPRV